MKIKAFKHDYAFLIFVSALSGFVFLFSGVGLLSAFLTAVFIYIFLRFCYFLWEIILKLAGRGGLDV